MTQSSRPPAPAAAFGDVPDDELLARISLIWDEVELAQGEAVLLRAAWERARERFPVRRGDVQAAAVRRAMVAHLAAVERFRVWARQLYPLQQEADARGLVQPRRRAPMEDWA